MPKSRTKRRARGTGSVFFSESRGVWVGRAWVDGVRVERSDPNQQEMLRKLARATPPAAGTTLADWLGRWLEDMKCRPQTRRLRERSVRNYLTPALGHLKVSALTAGQVERAAASWSATLTTPNSVRGVLSHLHTCLQAAVRAGLRPDNPAKIAARPKSEKTRVDTFTPAELATVVERAGDRPNTRVLALVAATGCRIGEALALDAADFDPEAGTVAISRTLGLRGELGPPKSANGVRTIRVPDAALPAVRAAHAGRKTGPLFPTANRTRPCYLVTRRSWSRMLHRMGVPYRNLHALRHSVATHLVAAGVPLADVAKYLGDAVATVVKVYLHPTDADPADALDRLFAPTLSPPYGPHATARDRTDATPGPPETRRKRSGRRAAAPG